MADETGKPVPKDAEEFVAEETGGELSNPGDIEPEKSDEGSIETLQEVEKRCAEIAMKYIADIKEQGKTIPTRFAFSGLSRDVFGKGFESSSFIVDDTYWGFDYNMINDTRNDALNHPEIRSQMKDLIFELRGYGGFSSDQEEVDYIERIKREFPDLAETFIKTLESYEEAIRKYEEPLESENTKKYTESYMNFYEKKIRLTPKIDEITDILKNFASSEQMPLINNIIRNFLTEKPVDEWSFEEQELWYEGMLSHFVLNNPALKGQGVQIYDMAYLADYSKISSQQEGYLPGIEREITSGPDAIMGVVKNSVRFMPENWITNKMTSLFKSQPELSRPIYDINGNLLWPRQMTHEEVRQFVAERDSKKAQSLSEKSSEELQSEPQEEPPIQPEELDEI